MLPCLSSSSGAVRLRGHIGLWLIMVVTHQWFHLHCVPWVCKPGCGHQNHSYICSISRVMSVLRIKLGLIEQLFLVRCSGHIEFMQIRVVTHELFHFHSVPWVWKPGCRHLNNPSVCSLSRATAVKRILLGLSSFSWYGSAAILDLCKLGCSHMNDFTCIMFLGYENLGVDTKIR